MVYQALFEKRLKKGYFIGMEKKIKQRKRKVKLKTIRREYYRKALHEAGLLHLRVKSDCTRLEAIISVFANFIDPDNPQRAIRSKIVQLDRYVNEGRKRGKWAFARALCPVTSEESSEWI